MYLEPNWPLLLWTETIPYLPMLEEKLKIKKKKKNKSKKQIKTDSNWKIKKQKKNNQIQKWEKSKNNQNKNKSWIFSDVLDFQETTKDLMFFDVFLIFF